MHALRVSAYNDGMTQTAYRHIARRHDGTPVIAGTRIKVGHLVGAMKAHKLTPGELAEQLEGLTLAQVYSALAYYEDHKEEIDDAIREGEAFAETLAHQLDALHLKELINERQER